MTTPTQIATPGPLLGLPATYSNFVFSDWVYLPNDGTVRGLTFGNNNLTIDIANNTSSAGANQIIVKAKDASDVAILDAEYQWSAWSNWVWIGITCDTATHQLQCWVSTAGYGDTQLTAASLTWSSTNPIGNDGSVWSLVPTS
jgi:hypothetical protein